MAQGCLMLAAGASPSSASGLAKELTAVLLTHCSGLTALFALFFCVWHRLKSGLEACAVPSHPEPTPAQLLEPLTDVFAQPRFINRR